LKDAQAVLASITALQRHADEVATDELREARIVFSPGAGAMTALVVQRIQTSIPGLKLRVDLRLSSEETLRVVESGQASMGISGLRSSLLDDVTLAVLSYSVLFVPSEHRLARHETVRMQDLDHEPVVLFERSLNPRHFDALVESFRTLGIEPDYKICHIASPVQMLEMVALGQGVAIMTQDYDCPPGIARAQIVGAQPASTRIYFVWSPQSQSGVVSEIVGVVQEFALEQQLTSGSEAK
jgi:DNA-binding transcriptional LysR family regulator